MDIIGGKWKPLIIYNLKDGTLRFSQIMDRVEPKITQRMLTKELREMEKDGLIIRKVYPQVPPKVEYSLTEKAESLIPILDALCDWDRNTWQTISSLRARNKGLFSLIFSIVSRLWSGALHGEVVRRVRRGRRSAAARLGR